MSAIAQAFFIGMAVGIIICGLIVNPRSRKD
jgi:hypothetical protein